MVSKKDLLARMMWRLGLLRLLETVPSKPQLLVLNYHRIGDAKRSLFDPGAFTTDADGFDEQLRLLSKRYRFATPDEALEVIEGRYTPSETVLLVTFDDGYRDTFEAAFPVMQSHGVKSILFVVTSYVEDRVVPWWDEIAYLAAQCRSGSLHMTYPRDETFDLAPANFQLGLRALLRSFKSPQMTEPERFLTELEAAVGCTREHIRANLMMNWEEVRAMKAAGTAIGLHTHTHRLLSKLPREEQRNELQLCKTVLERELGVEPRFLAYPVGQRDAFNLDTQQVAAEIGLRAAFSFYGGTNLPGQMNPFDVHRVAFDSYVSPARIRLAAAAMSATARVWI